MKTMTTFPFVRVATHLLVLLAWSASATTNYVWQESPSPTPPYSSWETAAHIIQDAVDAADPGDAVLVTNGIYSIGGRAVYKTMTNRVAVDKPLSLLSVNGPEFTIIEGHQLPGSVNGDGAIRCVYLTNGASLSGFTLTNGATRTSGNSTRETSGGGVLCESTNAVVTNCVIAGNSAHQGGAGAYSGTLSDCIIDGNSAGSSGGGSIYSVLNRCTLTANSATWGGGAYRGTCTASALTLNSASTGGGAYLSTLSRCTLAGNSARGYGGGADTCTLSHCIVFFNTAAADGDNYYGTLEEYYESSLDYCCTTPLPTNGVGNIASDPLLASGSHLSIGSPCIGAGNPTNAPGTDIDGEPWASPPSIGCDEPYVGSIGGPLSVAIQTSHTEVQVDFSVDIAAVISGQVVASEWDFEDGKVVSNRPYLSHSWDTLGDHDVILRAYNESFPAGISTTVTVHVVEGVYYVAADNPSPMPPYTSWATAATNIQDAVDAAIVPNATILVSNGVYSACQTPLDGLSSLVMVDRPLTVVSVNGPEFTVIDGCEVLRGVYLADGSSLRGFTITGGAASSLGGGIRCQSTNVWVSDCVITGNFSTDDGGGVLYGTLTNCVLSDNYGDWGGGARSSVLYDCTLDGNVATRGGGAAFASLNGCVVLRNRASNLGGGTYSSTLNNCTLDANSARSGGGIYSGTANNSFLTRNTASSGGGADGGTLNNCTLTGNSATDAGGGVRSGTLNNCIVYFNKVTTATATGHNYAGSQLNHCCTTPLPRDGVGNITLDPLLASSKYLSADSPCRAAGSAAYTSGVDIDGEPWASPPSIGCDEYWSGSITGSLSVTIIASHTNVATGFPVELSASIEGHAAANAWDFGDGTVVSNQVYVSHAWTTPGDYLVVFRVYNESWPGGISATAMIHVVAPSVHYVSAGGTNPIAPYLSWATAATNIQDAVDAASSLPGTLVLVTNGVYAMGGHEESRVVVDKPLFVQSVQGPDKTFIDGGGTNRCVVLTNRTRLSGFTLTNGYASGEGGGVWCASVDAVVNNCVLAGNQAVRRGGGAYSGTLNHCTLVDNSADTGGGSCFSILSACTLEKNDADDGGGAYDSQLEDCHVLGNFATYGGGGRRCVLSSCTLNENASYWGGGALESSLQDCVLTANISYNSGGGSAYCLLNNCRLEQNFAGGDGGGASQSTLNACVLNGNSTRPSPFFERRGGGAYDCTLNNCTLTGNSSDLGAGAHSSTLNNCIVYFNSAFIAGDNYDECELNYCCSFPLATNGTGNIEVDPRLASASHLSAGSPCIAAGDATSTSGVDIDGEPWATPPAIGCDEYHPGSITGPLGAAIEASYTEVAAGFSVDLIAKIDGHASASVWDFGDGTIISNQPYTDHAWAGSGDYVVVLTAYSESFPDGVTGTVTIHVSDTVHHVDVNGIAPTAPYDSWMTAATNIQDAVDVALPGALILVTNGVYATGGMAVRGTVTNRVAIDRPVTVQSVNGPEFTVIEGYQIPGTTNGQGAIRCAYLTNGASLVGFTLTKGATLSGVIAGFGGGGGGAFCESTNARLINCVLTGNSADYGGGGVYSGSLDHCAITDNASRSFGGGAFLSTLDDCVLSGNTAEHGGGAYSGTLNRCTLTANTARVGGGARSSALHDSLLAGNSADYGGGAYEGMLSGCTLEGNIASKRGGGADHSVLTYCTLTDNASDEDGGGAYEATLDQCTLEGNAASNAGGGAYGGTLNRCFLTGNSSFLDGGGASEAVLNSCSLSQNSAGASGGGAFQSTLSHCTLTGNSASEGGGVHSSTLSNSIVYFNTAAPESGNNYRGSVLRHCCAFPLPGGMGNIAEDPQLASASHLSADSPCIGAGSEIGSSGTDIDGEIWASPPAIGCDEYHPGSITGPLSVSILAAHTEMGAGFGVTFTAVIEGHAAASVWDFGDGVTVGNQPITSHAWAVPGDYEVVLRAYNETHPTGVSASVTVHVVTPPVHYAAADSVNPVPPYASWATAATTIQDAVDAAGDFPGARVLVTNGVYAMGGRAVHGTLTNRVTISQPLTVQSVNGPEVTVIAGHQVPGALNGEEAIRCVYLAEGATLIGFTLSHGATSASGDEFRDLSGGGLWCESTNAWALDCVFESNSAAANGGGAYSGKLSECRLAGNTAEYGGGVAESRLYDCVLMGNTARSWGGAAYYGTADRCTLTGNSAWAGGGTFDGTANNCSLSGNSADYAGGAYAGVLNSCTLVGNLGRQDGGGAYSATLNNCIAYYNSVGPSALGLNHRLCTINNSCTTPLPEDGVGNIDLDPLFVDTNVWADLHLQSNSPCIDAGNNDAVAGTTDLDGNPRIIRGTVDMGAYEFVPPNSPPVADASATQPVWISPDGIEAHVILDGSHSSDPDGDPLTYAWFSGQTLLADGVIAPVELPVGISAIALVVDDGLAQDTNSINVTVLTTGEAVDNLIALVNGSNLRQQRPLLASLEAGRASIDRGNCHSAVGQLHAFQNQVRAQVPDTALAEDLVHAADEVIAALHCDGAAHIAGSIHSIKRHSNGRMQLQINGEAGKTYILQGSTNLVDWEALCVVRPNAEGTCCYEDVAAVTHQSRFYRMVEP